MPTENPSTPSSSNKLIIGGIIVVGLIGIGGVAYNRYRIRRSLANSKTRTPLQPALPTPAPARQYQDIGWPLRQNSGGEKVAHVQMALNKIRKENLIVDGKWGPKTQAAVERLSKAFPTFFPKPVITEAMYNKLMAEYQKQVR